MTDEEIIDVEISQELVPAGTTSVTLFKTDDPVEIISKATHLADALSDVLKQKHLTTRIGNKDHVNVEGWTLCGTMLGVFPVVEWTRPVENGWEARVEARTLSGAVVGSAEAECLRTENRWRNADDYSVRSMAQTRAISKALRAPLGFIVALAGYETTPEEEMSGVSSEASAFDPGSELLPGAIDGENVSARLFEALKGFDPTVDWPETINEIVQSKYGQDSAKKLDAGQYAEFLRRLSNAVQWIAEHSPAGDFPPVEGAIIMKGFAFAFAPVSFTLAYKDIPAPLSTEQAALVDEALSGDDDIPFGEEHYGYEQGE